MKEILKFYKDFPKEGILFVDIIPFMQDKKSFNELMHRLGEMVSAPNIAAPEARGFLFAAPLLATKESVENIIPIRKSGKLPFSEGDLQAIEVEKEYGKDLLYYRKSDIAAGRLGDDGKFHITVLDDVLATGGTCKGIAESFSNCKIEYQGKMYEIVIDEFVFLVELDFLEGRNLLEKIAPVKSVIHL